VFVAEKEKRKRWGKKAKGVVLEREEGTEQEQQQQKRPLWQHTNNSFREVCIFFLKNKMTVDISSPSPSHVVVCRTYVFSF
jgi:hypothetical protein